MLQVIIFELGEGVEVSFTQVHRLWAHALVLDVEVDFFLFLNLTLWIIAFDINLDILGVDAIVEDKLVVLTHALVFEVAAEGVIVVL